MWDWFENLFKNIKDLSKNASLEYVHENDPFQEKQMPDVPNMNIDVSGYLGKMLYEHFNETIDSIFRSFLIYMKNSLLTGLFLFFKSIKDVFIFEFLINNEKLEEVVDVVKPVVDWLALFKFIFFFVILCFVFKTIHYYVNYILGLYYKVCFHYYCYKYRIFGGTVDDILYIQLLYAKINSTVDFSMYTRMNNISKPLVHIDKNKPKYLIDSLEVSNNKVITFNSNFGKRKRFLLYRRRKFNLKK